MHGLLGRLATWLVEMLDRSLTIVPDIDEP
jgi:hypothetical protein